MLDLLIARSWWSGSITKGGPAVGVLGLLWLGDREHIVWLASTKPLLSNPSSLVRQGRRWLEDMRSKLGIDLLALESPSNKRILKAWGFVPTERTYGGAVLHKL